MNCVNKHTYPRIPRQHSGMAFVAGGLAGLLLATLLVFWLCYHG